jgi:RNA polymerase sigma-70 factor (ECF subfamily)
MLAVSKSDPFRQAVRSRPAIASLAAMRENDLAASPGATDEALIAAIARGERQAMARLYARHATRVYRLALRIAGNAATAEDIVSEVFLDVWRQAGAFAARSQVSTWLLAIARNKSLSALRRRGDEPLDEAAVAAIADPADDPEAALDGIDRSTAMRRCLAQLPAVQREVIDLVYYHEKSVEDVARIVGAPAATVKTRMFYARRRLAELLAAAGYDHA